MQKRQVLAAPIGSPVVDSARRQAEGLMSALPCVCLRAALLLCVCPRDSESGLVVVLCVWMGRTPLGLSPPPFFILCDLGFCRSFLHWLACLFACLVVVCLSGFVFGGLLMKRSPNLTKLLAHSLVCRFAVELCSSCLSLGCLTLLYAQGLVLSHMPTQLCDWPSTLTHIPPRLSDTAHVCM